MKKNMGKIKSLIMGGIITLGLIGASSLDTYALTRSVKINGYIPSIMYSTTNMKAPKAYLCTYNAKGKFIKNIIK